MKVGAYDFIEKPFNTEQIRVVKNRAIESRKLKMAINDLKNQNKKGLYLNWKFAGYKKFKKTAKSIS